MKRLQRLARVTDYLHRFRLPSCPDIVPPESPFRLWKASWSSLLTMVAVNLVLFKGVCVVVAEERYLENGMFYHEVLRGPAHA